MKKGVFLLVVLVFSLALASCGAEEKEFSDVGITITLDDTFIKKDVIQAPLYLESMDYIFTGMRETKTSLTPYGISTLEDYIEGVLSANGHAGVTYESKTNDDGDVIYMYAYYTATVEDMDFGYMLLTMESDTYFYTMNFGCLESSLDDSKDQMFDWAETISVE